VAGRTFRKREALRCAIVGHGKAAELFAQILADNKQVDFVAVCGRDIARAKGFAARHGLAAFDDVSRMVESERIDVVVVATPHPSHASVANAAMRAGSHVLVEKPMATTVADCDRMLEAASRAGVTLGVVSQRRFYAPVQRVKRAIESGKIGTPALVTLTLLGWRDKEYYESDPWRGTWSGEGGGVLVNQAVHHLDLLLWLFGPVETVFGFWGNINHPEIEVDDTAVAVLRGAGGGLASIVVSNSQRPGLYANVHVHGTSGASVGVQTDGGQMFVAGVSEIVDPPVTDLWTVPGEEKLLSQFQDTDRAEFASVDPIVHYHRLQVEDFLDAVREGRSPLVTGADGRRAVELFAAIYRSNETGLAQHLSTPPPENR